MIILFLNLFYQNLMLIQDAKKGNPSFRKDFRKFIFPKIWT